MHVFNKETASCKAEILLEDAWSLLSSKISLLSSVSDLFPPAFSDVFPIGIAAEKGELIKSLTLLSFLLFLYL